MQSSVAKLFNDLGCNDIEMSATLLNINWERNDYGFVENLDTREHGLKERFGPAGKASSTC